MAPDSDIHVLMGIAPLVAAIGISAVSKLFGKKKKSADQPVQTEVQKPKDLSDEFNAIQEKLNRIRKARNVNSGY